MTSVPPQYQGYVAQAAAATGLPPSVVAAQINDESGFQPGVVSSAGAEGIAQFEPATFAQYGPSGGSPFNVGDAFSAYSAYMSSLLKSYKGNVADALAAYNAGTASSPAGQQYAATILAASGNSGTLSTTPSAIASTGTATGAAASGTGAAATPATTLAADISTTGIINIDPLASIYSIWQDITGVIKDPTDLASAAVTFARAFRDVAAMFGAFANAVQWLFVPSHWVRVAAFAGGTVMIVPGAYALMHTGQGGGGDVHLALGILLTTVSMVLFFIAFHNLPASVTDLQQLLGYISDGISGKAPAA